MAVGDAYVFPGFLTPVLTQLFFPKPPTTFLTCFCRGERRKYAGKKSRLNRGSNSQPPGHESDTLTTEPPGRGLYVQGRAYLMVRSILKQKWILWFPDLLMTWWYHVFRRCTKTLLPKYDTFIDKHTHTV